MGLGTGLARILLFIVTICFFLLGIASVAGGIWVLVGQDSLFYIMNLINRESGGDISGNIETLAGQKGVVQTAGIIILAVGAFILIISLFGCLGAIRESKCLLGCFAGSMALILAGQVALVVLFIRYRGVIETNSKSALTVLQNKYLVSVNDFTTKTKQPENSVSLLLNYLYVWGECCGSEAKQDAAKSESWQKSNRTWMGVPNSMTVPAACCPMTQEGKQNALKGAWSNVQQHLVEQTCPVTKNNAYDKTCYDSIVNLIGSYQLWVIIGVAALAAVQIFVILFTVCLICAIDD